MLARDVMTKTVVSVRPDTPVSEIANTLLNGRISAVPVVDAENRILGIVSEGDLMRRPESDTEPHHSWWLRIFETAETQAAEYVKSHGLRAEEVMTAKVVTVTEDTPVGEIARILEERRIKRVPVVSDDELVGIVSRANLLHALASRPSSGPNAPTDDDRTLRKKILDEVAHNPEIDAEFINLTVADGTVDLWGIAESVEEKNAIRIAAEYIAGEGRVIDHVGVMTPNTRALLWID
jgi:CBS domain-containing protein